MDREKAAKTMKKHKRHPSQIKYYDNAIKQNETGTVLMVGDGIARASGLINCMAGELLEFKDGSFGMAQNLEENSVSIVLFGDDSGIGEGQTVKRTGKVVSVPVGEAMIGRVVNALGQPIDGAGPVVTSEYRAIESPAPGICERQGVYISLCRPVLRQLTPWFPLEEASVS